MNGNHNVKDLDLLYLDAKKIINEIVLGKFDGNILKVVNEAINNLQDYWHSQDGIVQINKLIDVKNLLIDNRDILGNIGVYISMLAKNYRDAQNASSTVLPSFSQLDYKKLEKVQKIPNGSSEIYMNNDISNVVTSLEIIVNNIDEVNSSTSIIRKSIFDNWIQEDANRNYAMKMFDKFADNMAIIITEINGISKNISTAIDNYNLSVNAVSSMPSLESMINVSQNNIGNTYTSEEQKVLSSIEKNFDYNKRINDKFNNILVNEVKKDLISKGIIE